MTRVMVIGNAGGGKSVLSRVLARVHGLPLHEVDRILWRPGWQRVPEAEFLAAHDRILAGRRWVIDGVGSWESVSRRLAAADTVVLIDLPLRVHLWWATKRQVKAILGGRPDGPDGCPMGPVTIRLYRMIWRLHREMRPLLLAAVEARRGKARVIHIRSARALAAFAANPI